MFKYKGVRILGTGSFVPPFSVKNEDFREFIDTGDEWITTRTGIKERRFMIGKPNHYMAVKACENALENAKVSSREIDAIIIATCTPDFSYPCMAGIVQHELKATSAACMDVNVACTGFITAFDLARNFFLAGKYKKILVAASEKLSSHTDFSDRRSCVLFGDCAGAVVLEPAEGAEYESFFGAIGEDIERPEIYYRYNHNSNIPFGTKENTEDNLTNYKDYFQMNGKTVYKFGVEAMQKSVNKVLEQAGLTVDGIDLLIPHQANLRIIQTASKALKIPAEKVYTNIETRANTSSACIPSCLDELNESGRLKNGMIICMVGFGGGLTYGAVLMTL